MKKAKYYTAPGAAELLGVGNMTIYRAYKSGELKAAVVALGVGSKEMPVFSESALRKLPIRGRGEKRKK